MRDLRRLCRLLFGQILIEDYYVANKLMKGFIGAANIDTNSRLCMASSVAGHRRAFGSDTVPGLYADIEAADLVVLVGSNLAWCHPVLHQRLAAAREKRATRIVVIDPRRTETCDIADLHLPLAPGSDVALFNGLLAHLDATDKVDRGYVARHTNGFAATLAEARRLDLEDVAAITRLPRPDIEAFFDLFASVPRVVTVYSQGVNQSSAGTDKVNAIINCHLASARIGKPGAGPFSVTGQPNAMGGREVGGLANALAAHKEFDNTDHRRIVADYWRAPRLARRPGLKAVDLFRAIEDRHVKSVWIMGTNPVDSMPEADRVRAALHACPFVVVSDVCERTDTTLFAARAAAEPCLGREGRHGDEFRTSHLPSASVSAGTGRGEGRLAANGGSRAAHGLRQGFLLPFAGRNLPRIRGDDGPQQ
jgi:assimilatory nitrate reductase catalytic subunit